MNSSKVFNRFTTKKLYSAGRIFNSKESGISTDLSSPKIIPDKSQKFIGQIVSAESVLVTLG